MARLPIYQLADATAGEEGAGVELLHELARRLRDHPTPGELELAAAMLERAALAGAEGVAAALLLTHPHRPRTSRRAWAIYTAMDELIAAGSTIENAARAVAPQFSASTQHEPAKTLSPGRAKKIYLELRQAVAEDREARQEEG